MNEQLTNRDTICFNILNIPSSYNRLISSQIKLFNPKFWSKFTPFRFSRSSKFFIQRKINQACFFKKLYHSLSSSFLTNLIWYRESSRK